MSAHLVLTTPATAAATPEALPLPASSLPALSGVIAAVNQVVLGKPDVVHLAAVCLLARGHLLVEDRPGVGKTTLARALARTLGLTHRRIQFVADLLPGDILGSAVLDAGSGRFAFHHGPIFAGIVLADEINRASPRTQSALLEAMEEGVVSEGGTRHALPNPFFVIATQNPVEQAGTWPLPDSQLDRFLMRLSLGFPDRDSERALLAGPDRHALVEALPTLLDPERLRAAQDAAERIHVAAPLRDYLLDLLAASRGNQRGTDAHAGASGSGDSGLSPRAGLALQRAAKAHALLAGRDAVLPEDVQAVGVAVMAHRLGGIARAERLLRTVSIA